MIRRSSGEAERLRKESSTRSWGRILAEGEHGMAEEGTMQAVVRRHARQTRQIEE